MYCIKASKRDERKNRKVKYLVLGGISEQIIDGKKKFAYWLRECLSLSRVEKNICIARARRNLSEFLIEISRSFIK